MRGARMARQKEEMSRPEAGWSGLQAEGLSLTQWTPRETQDQTWSKKADSASRVDDGLRQAQGNYFGNHAILILLGNSVHISK